jgi:hypothetical protein
VTHRWLGLALFAEGPTDHRFLDELLRRTVEHLLVDGGHAVDLSPVQRLPLFPCPTTRAERIATGSVALQGAFHLLFVHADGAGDPQLARSERIVPGIEAMHTSLGDDGRRGVAVVPIRETEAWALADVDCLRRVLGTRLSAVELGVPESANELENLANPKATFAQVVRLARPGRRGRRRPASASFLDLIGQQARLSELARLSAFGARVDELDSALTDLGFRG